MVEVSTADGAMGTGEASLHFADAEVCAALACIGQRLEGLTVREAIDALRSLEHHDLPRVAARCALDQALHDIEAQRQGVPIWGLLRGRESRRFPVYANVNRRTRDRRPEGFAASARSAVEAGFDAVKIAPFDNLTPRLGSDEAHALLDAGFARIAAVRAAIGPDRNLLVDCHWRLSPPLLTPVVRACAELGVYWIETPFTEDAEQIPAIVQARRQANARGMLTAGAELETAGPKLDRLISERCYDVLMPDMKYVGGYRKFIAVSEAAAAHGIRIAPHNPTGPVCHAHSAHASAAIDNLLILEMQFDETPLFAEVVTGKLPLPEHGLIEPPSGPGLGARLDPELLASVESA
jgi:galactonate dehydratase